MKGEAQVHQMVCDYLRLQYPNVIFKSDFGAGMKMSKGQAVRQKRLQSGRAWPDLFIAECSGDYSGLFIEIKNEGVKTHKKDGKLRADPHLMEQAQMLDQLQQRGFYATFASGFQQCKEVIDEYLSDTYFRNLTDKANQIPEEEGQF